MLAGDKVASAPDAVLPPDTLVGTYRIRALIGEGAMGEVYLAQDIALGRRVALKLVKRSVIQAGGLARFIEEGKTTASFSHPHIVTLHAVGEHDGRPFLALEYVDGESLRARIAAGPLSVREALRIMRAVADAIAEAHRRGLVHADLKPENVVIPRDGRVRVVDFGLAKLVGASVDTASGTPAYMAPERWRGEAPTGAIDIWALGIMLHELITGKRPLDDTELARLAFAKHRQDAVYKANGTVWSALVAECLLIDPVSRIDVEELARRLGAQLNPRAEVDTEPHCPFPGLSAFSRDEAANYFGRRAELDAIVEQLRMDALIPVVGPSGVGKSSFVYAALIPRLEDTGPWSVRALRPGASPYARLAAALTAGASEPLAEQLRRHPETLSLVLAELAKASHGRMLVFVDQFEEAFTLAPAEALAFTECLAKAAMPDEPWRFILTVRDDFFGKLAEAPAMRGLLGAVVPLAPLSTADLRAAVQGPLANCGYAPDRPELVGQIVRDVEGTPAALPLLQFACRSLWDRRDPTTHTILAAEYEAMGGASGALAAHAQGLMSRLSGAQIRIARTILLALVHPDGTRRPRQRAELLAQLPPEAVEILDRLLDGRLVVAGREPEKDDARIELAHEALTVAWPQLARWLDESFEERLLVTELEQASQLWERRGKRDDETWAGAALGEALRKVSEWNVQLPTAARAFIDAGRDRDRRVRRRRRWLLGGAIGLLAAVAIVAMFVAIAFARQERKDALAKANLGTFTLELVPFEWDPQLQRSRTPSVPPSMQWRMYGEDRMSVHDRAQELTGSLLRRHERTWNGKAWIQQVEAPAGPAILEVSDRGGACAPSRIYLKSLPGYHERLLGEPIKISVAVPTCQATRAGMIEIPAGAYYRNIDRDDDGTEDRPATLPTFWIDRTEVTRGAFAIFDGMEPITGDGAAHGAEPVGEHTKAGSLRLPAVGISFLVASDYCRYMGKQLPTVDEWQKAMRGGITMHPANANPTRSAPWASTTSKTPANLNYDEEQAGPAPVGSFPEDTSPYGVVDLAGNVSEWSRSLVSSGSLAGLRTVMGASWDTPPQLGHQYVQWRNTRNDRYLDFVIGLRCVDELSLDDVK